MIPKGVECTNYIIDLNYLVNGKKIFNIRPDPYDSTKAFILLCRTMGMNFFTLAVEDEIFLEIKELQNSHVIKH